MIDTPSGLKMQGKFSLKISDQVTTTPLGCQGLTTFFKPKRSFKLLAIMALLASNKGRSTCQSVENNPSPSLKKI